MTVRTRFAPSPTGHLHVGGARVALFAWLFAKHHQGEFLLRIEDTDSERSTAEAVDVILEGMSWLGLTPDQEPIFQTQRLSEYQAVIQDLLERQLAYRCTCSKERLESLRESQMAKKDKPRYDGQCRDKNIPASETPFVVRFKNPETGSVDFSDAVYGDISIQNKELDDLIIQRSDGMPTYNLSVVVDDSDMEITHVIRGDDHINNTPRQINLLRALGRPVPIYAHLPMILGSDGKRLSKRHGAVSVLEYREEGYLPDALLNYLVRLGWSHGDDEIFSLDEMIAHFDLTSISRGAAAFDTDKLLWLNQHYLKALPLEDITARSEPLFLAKGYDLSAGPTLSDIIALQRERSKTLNEMVEKSHYFYQAIAGYDEKAARKLFKPEVAPVLAFLLEKVTALVDWEFEAMHQLIIDTAEHFDLKMGQVAQPTRLALTGNTVSPPIDATLYWIGRDQVAARLEQAIDFVEKSADSGVPTA